MTYVAVDIVRVDGEAALGGGELDARLHNVAHRRARDVEPPLAGPVAERLSHVGLVKLVLVAAPVLVGARAEVANDADAGIVKLDKRLGVVVEHVEVVGLHLGRHLAVVAQLDGLAEDDLPRRAGLGLVHGGSVDSRVAARWLLAIVVVVAAFASGQADAKADCQSDDDEGGRNRGGNDELFGPPPRRAGRPQWFRGVLQVIVHGGLLPVHPALFQTARGFSLTLQAAARLLCSAAVWSGPVWPSQGGLERKSAIRMPPDRPTVAHGLDRQQSRPGSRCVWDTWSVWGFDHGSQARPGGSAPGWPCHRRTSRSRLWEARRPGQGSMPDTSRLFIPVDCSRTHQSAVSGES